VINTDTKALIKISLSFLNGNELLVFIQIKIIKENFKIVFRVIFAIVLVGLSADLTATQGMYQVMFFLCQNSNDKVNKNLPLLKSAAMRTGDRYRGV